MPSVEMKDSAKKTAFLGAFIGVGLILAYVESLFPNLIPVPGIKLGLPNVAVLFLLYRYGWKEAAGVNLVRILISCLLFSSVLSLFYSLMGALLSFAVMALLRRSGFAKITVSVLGAVAHNAGQILAAFLATETAQVVYYLPALIISGTVTGILIGILGGILLKKLEKVRAFS